MLNMLPVSLFGMAISAAELPAMSGKPGSEAEVAGYLRQRLNAGLRQIAFFIVPSAMAFLALGDVIAGALFETGKFRRAESVYVWAILAGSAVGLLASTMGRLYSNAYYALRDTRTPLRFAIIRIALTTVLGCFCAFLLPRWLGIEPRWGVAGLTASAGVAGWVEFTLLRLALNKRIGESGLPVILAGKLWTAAAIAAAAGWGVKLAIGRLLQQVSATSLLHQPVVAAAPILAVYGLTYFGIAYVFKVPELTQALTRFGRLRR
jgi:putative peptidoglycan lipid II flippase